jgi:hypothetical protein
MLVNFDVKLEDLDGKIISEKDEDGNDVAVKTSTLIALCLISPQFQKEDYIKRFELAQKIKQEVEFEIDTSDFALVEEAVQVKSGSMTPLAKAQILRYFRNIRAANAAPIKKKDK